MQDDVKNKSAQTLRRRVTEPLLTSIVLRRLNIPPIELRRESERNREIAKRRDSRIVKKCNQGRGDLSVFKIAACSNFKYVCVNAYSTISRVACSSVPSLALKST